MTKILRKIIFISIIFSTVSCVVLEKEEYRKNVKSSSARDRINSGESGANSTLKDVE